MKGKEHVSRNGVTDVHLQSLGTPSKVLQQLSIFKSRYINDIYKYVSI